MRLRAYENGDLARFEARADFRGDFDACGGRLPLGRKFTLEADDGRVLGVAGLKWLDGYLPRQMGAWAYLSEMRPREWLWAAKRAREVCRWGCALLGVDLYATPADTDEAMRLLGFIGFRPSPDDAGVWKFMGDI